MGDGEGKFIRDLDIRWRSSGTIPLVGRSAYWEMQAARSAFTWGATAGRRLALGHGMASKDGQGMLLAEGFGARGGVSMTLVPAGVRAHSRRVCSSSADAATRSRESDAVVPKLDPISRAFDCGRPK
jgi:hypothetical protein